MHLSRGIGRSYYPMASPTIVGEFARLRPGDERALLKFVHRWGSLGYDRLHDRAALDGDPVAWVWAHANGVRTVLDLHKLIRKRDGDGLAELLKGLALSQRTKEPLSQVNLLLRDRERVGETADLVPDLFASPEKPDEYWSPVVLEDGESFRPAIIYGQRDRIDISPYLGFASEDPRRAAYRWIFSIVNPNLKGVYRRLTDLAPTEALASERPGLPNLVWSFDALISVIYYHLAEIVTQTRLAICDNCGLPFVQTDARQRFCPPARWEPPTKPEKESRCGQAYRKRVKRGKERKG